jgi:hypothetical protein
VLVIVFGSGGSLIEGLREWGAVDGLVDTIGPFCDSVESDPPNICRTALVRQLVRLVALTSAALLVLSSRLLSSFGFSFLSSSRDLSRLVREPKRKFPTFSVMFRLSFSLLVLTSLSAIDAIRSVVPDAGTGSVSTPSPTLLGRESPLPLVELVRPIPLLALTLPPVLVPLPSIVLPVLSRAL